MKAPGLADFGQEGFLIAIWKPVFTPWPTYATSQNGFNNFGRGPSNYHSCEVWSKPLCSLGGGQLMFSLYNAMLNCEPVSVVNFDPRGIIWTTLVEDLQMMLYTKYECSGLVLSDENIFENCILKTYVLLHELCMFVSKWHVMVGILWFVYISFRWATSTWLRWEAQPVRLGQLPVRLIRLIQFISLL